jgi:RNA polymerase sigma-70 factor (ECF subfamily)
MALGNENHVPKIIPIRRESMNLGRPSQGAEGELLAGLRTGRPSAVDELLRLYQGKIFNLAMSILKNESDAEEAAQDVFMTVIRKADTFQGNSAFYSWMYRICVNTCLMRLRGKRRTETVSLEEFMPVFTDEGMHASPMGDWSKEVERNALNEELGRMIRMYTEELSEKYRVVFVLSDVEGLSNEETAKILGLTVPAVKSRLHRARLYLHEQLSRYLLEGSSGLAVRQPDLKTGIENRHSLQQRTQLREG